MSWRHCHFLLGHHPDLLFLESFSHPLASWSDSPTGMVAERRAGPDGLWGSCLQELGEWAQAVSDEMLVTRRKSGFRSLLKSTTSLYFRLRSSVELDTLWLQKRM